MKKMIASMLVLFMGITISAQVLPKATTKGAVRLFGDKDDLTSVLLIIPDGSTVDVVKPDSVFTRVLFEGADGFVKSDRLVTARLVLNDEPARASYEAVSDQPAVWQQQQQQSQQQAVTPEYFDPADRYEMLANKYGTDIGKRLYQHKVWKGVNSDMARDSWGKPVQINRMYVDQSVDEEWIYSKKYLYFRDGVLIEWGPVK
jgi:hypothetical protein